MKRSRIFPLIIFFIISSFVYSQTLKTEFPAEQQIDVIENLGKYVPA